MFVPCSFLRRSLWVRLKWRSRHSYRTLVLDRRTFAVGHMHCPNIAVPAPTLGAYEFFDEVSAGTPARTQTPQTEGTREVVGELSSLVGDYTSTFRFSASLRADLRFLDRFALLRRFRSGCDVLQVSGRWTRRRLDVVVVGHKRPLRRRGDDDRRRV